MKAHYFSSGTKTIIRVSQFFKESKMNTGNVVIEFTKEEAVILAENLQRSLRKGEVISTDVDSVRSIISCACDSREWEQ